MPRDPRTFITVHDGMPEHPKVEGLSDGAFRLMVETWCWCSRQLTDGRVPANVWAKRGTAETRRELIGAGLVEDHTDSVQMHDYTEHQRTAAEVAERRAKRADAGRKGGLAKAGKPVASATARAKASAKQSAKQTGSKSLAETETDTERHNPSDYVMSGISDEIPDDASRTDVEAVCNHLANRIVENGSKRPTITKAWRDAARLLIDKDGRTQQQVMKAIDWCQTDEFWRGNIMSMPKLRDQYDRLRLAAERKAAEAKRPTSRQQATTDLLNAAMQRAVERDAQNGER